MLSPTAIEPAVQRIRDVYAGWSRQTTPARMREDWDRLFRPETVVAAVEQVRIGAVSATWVEGPADRVFLYLPGGGYRVGSSRSHLDIIARIARAGGCAGLGVDYRLAPEHRFPAPIIDALSIYGWLLASDVPPERIAVVGDSAGGNLALALLLALKDRNEPLPACVALLSPWTDLQATGGSYVSRAHLDPLHRRSVILGMAQDYLGEADPAQPLASPLRGDLTGLPPMLVQVGDREVVLGEPVRLARRARAAGVPVELQVWPGMFHVFQQFPDELPEAGEAISEIGRFLDGHLGKAP